MLRKTSRVSIGIAAVVLLSAMGAGSFWIQSRRVPPIPTIALIPQTAGALLWEAEHQGASAAAEKLNCHLYWNTPTSETDVAGQISLIDRVGRGRYQGLVLAPNHPLAILAPLRRAITTGLPVVIVSAQLDLPPSPKLGYIVNDDDRMGELAAGEVARLLEGKGTVALIGMARYAPGVNRRARAAERFLASQFPQIQVVSRSAGAHNMTLSEELTNAAVNSHPGLKAVLSFTATSTRGVYSALKDRSLQQNVHLVGCEQDSDLITYVGNGEIAAVVAENTYRMGYEAVELIAASWRGKPIPARSVIPPLLITKQNFNSAVATLFTSLAK